MIIRVFGQVVRNMIQLGQIYGSVVGECVGRVTVSIGGRGVLRYAETKVYGSCKLRRIYGNYPFSITTK